MKSSETIIAHLIKKPHIHKVAQKRCIHKLLGLLPSSMAKSVAFFYIKNKTLFFVLNHPGMKMEFNYKHNLIKTLLNKIKDIDSSCRDLEILQIKSFVSNKIPEKSEPVTSTLHYTERAEGAFENYATDPELKALFERIKEVIKAR
ncbi:MAG: hypothetical protein B6D59_05685 [Campylobacteraceae bacterium 4484_4]|nr:MAG: hypothetical protein B6D59_05685 [Campylobacteraceae bacterium 4484_4]